MSAFETPTSAWRGQPGRAAMHANAALTCSLCDLCIAVPGVFFACCVFVNTGKVWSLGGWFFSPMRGVYRISYSCVLVFKWLLAKIGLGRTVASYSLGRIKNIDQTMHGSSKVQNRVSIEFGWFGVQCYKFCLRRFPLVQQHANFSKLRGSSVVPK